MEKEPRTPQQNYAGQLLKDAIGSLHGYGSKELIRAAVEIFGAPALVNRSQEADEWIGTAKTYLEQAEQLEQIETMAPTLIPTFGANLIAIARDKQLRKGYTYALDKLHDENELLRAAFSVVFSDLQKWPEGWNKQVWANICKKSLTDRLAIAGAFIAAEIDRLNIDERVPSDTTPVKPYPDLSRDTAALENLADPVPFTLTAHTADGDKPFQPGQIVEADSFTMHIGGGSGKTMGDWAEPEMSFEDWLIKFNAEVDKSRIDVTFNVSDVNKRWLDNQSPEFAASECLREVYPPTA